MSRFSIDDRHIRHNGHRPNPIEVGNIFNLGQVNHRKSNSDLPLARDRFEGNLGTCRGQYSDMGKHA